jgi:hypothetical protein
MTFCFFHAKPGEPTSLWLWNILWNNTGGIESTILLVGRAADSDCGCGAAGVCAVEVTKAEEKKKTGMANLMTALAFIVLFSVNTQYSLPASGRGGSRNLSPCVGA